MKSLWVRGQHPHLSKLRVCHHLYTDVCESLLGAGASNQGESHCQPGSLEDTGGWTPLTVSDSVGPGWGLSIHIFNKFLGDADTAGLGTTL